ncbi:MAG: isocitrate/isopropylmalate family dehydrogenase, partial [Chloroflexota bacterium]
MSSPTSAKIVLLPGDGVGPEVVGQAVRVLEAVASRWGHTFAFETVLMGGAAHDAHGEPLRDADVEVCRSADALLLGAVGGPKYDAVRTVRGLLKLRKALELNANLRPVSVLPALYPASPLKPELLAGVDILVVRELTGGIYFGQPSHQTEDERGKVAVDTLVYHQYEVERVVRLAFDLARQRRKQVASVDKANVLQSSRMWRTIVDEIAKEYSDVAY